MTMTAFSRPTAIKRIASLSASLRVAVKILRSSLAIAVGSALLSGTSAIDMPLI